MSRVVIVELIAATRTAGGLSVHAELNEAEYETGRKVSEEETASHEIEHYEFHGEWNYSIVPHASKNSEYYRNAC